MIKYKLPTNQAIPNSHRQQRMWPQRSVCKNLTEKKCLQKKIINSPAPRSYIYIGHHWIEFLQSIKLAFCMTNLIKTLKKQYLISVFFNTSIPTLAGGNYFIVTEKILSGRLQPIRKNRPNIYPKMTTLVNIRSSQLLHNHAS